MVMNPFENGAIPKQEKPLVPSAMKPGVHHELMPGVKRTSMGDRVLAAMREKEAANAAANLETTQENAEAPAVIKNVAERYGEQPEAKPYNAVLAKRDADERMRKAQKDQEALLKARAQILDNPALGARKHEEPRIAIDMKSAVMFQRRELVPVVLNPDGSVLCVTRAELNRVNAAIARDSSLSASDAVNRRESVSLLPDQMRTGQAEAKRYQQPVFQDHDRKAA